jgi:hypothetical protein
VAQLIEGIFLGMIVGYLLGLFSKAKKTEETPARPSDTHVVKKRGSSPFPSLTKHKPKMKTERDLWEDETKRKGSQSN